jgi:hypothetical protein
MPLASGLQRAGVGCRARAPGARHCRVHARGRGGPGSPKGIACTHHNDGDGCCRLHSGLRRGRTGCHDDIYLQPDELGRVFAQQLLPPFRRPMLDGDVLPFHIAEVAECLPEWLPDGVDIEQTYPWNLCGLLRPRRQRRGEGTKRKATKERAPVHHAHLVRAGTYAGAEAGSRDRQKRLQIAAPRP